MASYDPGDGGARAAGADDPRGGGAHAVGQDDDPRDRGIGELVKDLASQTSTLVRQEIKLAQAEVTQKGKLAGKGAGMLAGAAVTALLGLGALTALLIIALDGFLPLWLAALIVTLLWFAVAAVLGLSGKKALQAATPPVPQTVETVKEDIQWAKTQTGFRREIEQTRAEMGETVDALGYKTDVKARAKDSIQEKKESVMGVASSAKDRVVGATPDKGEVKHQARRAKSVAEENPLGLAVGALAVGFLAGMLIPSTRIEDEKLGEISDDVIERAKDTGQEALERGKQVAQEAAQSAQETVKESGQEHADELRSTAQDHAQEAASSARS